MNDYPEPLQLPSTTVVPYRRAEVARRAAARQWTPTYQEFLAGEELAGVGIGAGAGVGLETMTRARRDAMLAAQSGMQVSTIPTGQETVFDGIESGELPDVTPVALPIALAGLGALTLGFLRGLWAKFGPTIIRALVGGAAFGAIMKLIMGDDSDDKIVDVDKLKGRGKRYSIGRNPRVRTLAKVSRHCQRLLKRHEKVIREFLPQRKVRYGIPPARVLSAVERKAIRSGG